jgi:hypothetical protein
MGKYNYKILEIKDLPNEIWKDIPEYEGYYQASNLGRVKSLWYSKGKILKQGFCREYLVVRLYKKGMNKTGRVNQLVAMAFLGHKPCGHKIVVDHINNIKTDNRAENLQLVSNRHNSSKDKFRYPKSSKYVGVVSLADSKWRSHIRVNGKRIILGTFTSEEEAHRYYKNAVKAIREGNEIKIRRRQVSSKYKGVSWDRFRNYWVAQIVINGKKIYLGSFQNEYDAHLAFQNKVNSDIYV